MLALVAAGLFLLAVSMHEKEPKTGTRSVREPMVRLIRAEAKRQGVPAPIALAVAEVESNFNPAARGDLAWAEKRPELYEKLVRDNPAMARNPARNDRKAWHSYGLYQLLAPHFVRGMESPSLLLDPEVNAQRGIAFIKSLLKKHDDDLAQMRLAYAGAQNANALERARVLERFTQAYERWRKADAGGVA